MVTKQNESRVNDLFKVESDIDGIKKFIFSVVLGLITIVAGGGVWVGNIATRVTSIEEVSHDVESRQRLADISSARIETKLANIEVVLIEIKRNMK